MSHETKSLYTVNSIKLILSENALKIHAVPKKLWARNFPYWQFYDIIFLQSTKGRGHQSHRLLQYNLRV
jgi:hypothetical protein